MNKLKRRHKFKELVINTKKNKTLFFMCLPVCVYFLLFAYVPLIGLVIAFKDYDFIGGIFGSRWCGLDNIKFFFTSGQAAKLTINTFKFNITAMIVNTITQIAFALFLAEVKGKYYKKICQTITLLPHFISSVVIGIFVYNFLNYDTGFLTKVISAFGFDKPQFYSMPKAWFPILIIVKMWQGLGYGSIVYLAAIKGIDTSIYEAAEIDGANVWRRVWHITLPMLMPTLIILVLLSLGQILRGSYDLFYQLMGDNVMLYNEFDIIDSYVFRAVASGTDYGVTSAVSLYQSILCFITIVIANKLVKLYDADYALY